MSVQYKSIKELKNMLNNKDISHTELIQETFLNIKNNSKLNAFISLNEDESLKKANNLDHIAGSGSLAGIPIAQKDLFCTKDLKTTCGSNMLSNFIPPYSATVIENLENAGCISIGKTNMDEFAMGSSNETSFYGNVQNGTN